MWSSDDYNFDSTNTSCRTFHHCGAVIISPFHLLTTAHCLWDYRDTTGIYYVRYVKTHFWTTINFTKSGLAIM